MKVKRLLSRAARSAAAFTSCGSGSSESFANWTFPSTRRTLSVAALALSLMLAGSSYIRWHQVQEAMRQGRPLPRPWAIPVLSTAMVAVAGAVAIALAVR